MVCGIWNQTDDKCIYCSFNMGGSTDHSRTAFTSQTVKSLAKLLCVCACACVCVSEWQAYVTLVYAHLAIPLSLTIPKFLFCCS